MPLYGVTRPQRVYETPKKSVTPQEMHNAQLIDVYKCVDKISRGYISITSSDIP